MSRRNNVPTEEQLLQEKAAKAVLRAVDPVEKLRYLCLQRGSAGILGFGKVFRRMDDDGSGSLSFAEFDKGLHDSGFVGEEALSRSDIQQLFAQFDADGSGSISYDEFLAAIRPPMNATRTKLVEAAYAKMDVTKDGKVTLEDLKKVYNVKLSPDYINGKKTEDEILNEFLSKFEQNMARPSSPTAGDGVLTKNEFIDYYSGVSASIDDDLYFDLMMRKAWKL